MNNQGFSTTFTVDQTPEEAFAAIIDVWGWWSEEVEGNTNKPGEAWTYHYKDVHICKLKTTELVPNKKVVWLVIENYFNFTKDETEWTGTELIFEISQKGEQTEVHFTHRGLVPEYECFDICTNSWGFYINSSLWNLITNGRGEPNHSKSTNLVDEVEARHE